MQWAIALALALVALGLAVRLRVVTARGRADADRAHRLGQEKEMVVRFMHEMVEALGDGVARTELLQRIARTAVQCAGAVSACVYETLPDGSLRGAAVEGLFPPQKPLAGGGGKLASRAKFIEQVLRSEVLRRGDGIVGAVAAQRRGELIADVARDPRYVDHGDPALALRSMIAMPIESRGNLVGVLAVANPAGGDAFTETDFSVVQSLAEQAGLALHNNEFLALQVEKRQMDLDLSIAQEIQQLLVPQRLPALAGFEIETRYIPAKQVGGDLVDAVPLADGRIALVVADVSGKSVGASILMAICRTRIRHALGRHASPAAVLREVNQGMVGEFRPDMFVTAVLAIVDGATGEVVVARAGHEAPLSVRPTVDRPQGVSEFIALEGMALGIGEPHQFDEAITDRAIHLAPGDALVLYTDGLTEAVNPEGKEFSAARLADAVRISSERGSAAICEGVLETVRRFTGATRYADDLSLLVVRRSG